MTEPRLRRSVLIVPAGDERKIRKAAASLADEVILDFEDSVPLDRKDEARRLVAEIVPAVQWRPGSLSVRVNAFGTPWFAEDLATVVEPLAGFLVTVVLPKVSEAEHVGRVDEPLTGTETRTDVTHGRLGITVMIENPSGLVEIGAILGASPRVRVVTFGPGDLAGALGMPVLGVGAVSGDYPGDPWHWVRMALLVHARKHGIAAIDGPIGNVRDPAAFATSARASRALGFDGKWILHPDQIGPANEVYSVSQRQFEEAMGLVEAYRRAVDTDGRGAGVAGNEMVDEANRKIAQRIVEQGRQQGLPYPEQPG